jgi:ABC-2 type transport system ATP-binding protein
VENSERFYMISRHQFKLFHSGEDFMDRYSAKNLDEAFIRAAAQ